MTSEPRAWVRPDGTLVARTASTRSRTWFHGVEFIAHNASDPSDATPLVAAPKVDGDDHHEAKVSAVLDVLRKAASGAIGSTGLTTATKAAPWLRELAERCVVATERPGQLPRAAALVAREDTASRDESARTAPCPVCGADVELLDSIPSLAPVIDDHEWLGVQCSGTGATVSRPAPAQRTEAPDVQRAAPTRDALVGAFDDALFYTAPDGARVFRWTDERLDEVDEPLLANQAERMADVALGVLRGGGADGSGEDEDVEPRCGAYHSEYGFTCRDLPKGHGRWHWDRAGGYWDHDGQHIDGMVREPEAIEPTGLADENGELRNGSLGRAEWRHDNGDRVIAGNDRRVVVFAARGHVTANPDWLARAIHSAKRWVDAYLEVGDEVTGDRAVSAPVGTTLGAKSAAVAAVHTANGWSVTGMSRGQDHEGHVRLNEWVVLALPEAES